MKVFSLNMIKCRRRQTTDPQKFKKLSTVVLSFLLVEAVKTEAIGVKAKTVDEIVASTSLVLSLIGFPSHGENKTIAKNTVKNTQEEI